MELTLETVHRIVTRLFSPADHQAALAMLEQYGTAAWEGEIARVRVAALKVSGGKIAELERAVAAAKVDYRDVLSWAEYPTELVKPTWEMPGPDVAQIRTTDRSQYMQWLIEITKP